MTKLISLTEDTFLDIDGLKGKTTQLYQEIADRYPVAGPKVPILPYIEDNYCDQNTLKVMHVGMNAYTAEKDFTEMENPAYAKEASGWWSSWAKENKFPIHQWIHHNHQAFSGFTSSQYRCNAVKIWLPTSVGKQERLVAKEVFEEAKNSMRSELDLLCELGLRPDVVVCYGSQAWRTVWPYFYEKHGESITELQKHVAFKVKLAPNPLLVCRVLHHGGKRFQGKMAAMDAHKIVEKFNSRMDWDPVGS